MDAICGPLLKQDRMWSKSYPRRTQGPPLGASPPVWIQGHEQPGWMSNTKLSLSAWTYNMRAREVTCKSDSQVMIGQINGEFEFKEPFLERYYHTVRNSIAWFQIATLEDIHRKENKRVDAQSRLSTTKKESHHSSIKQIWLRQHSVADDGFPMSSSWMFVEDGAEA